MNARGVTSDEAPIGGEREILFNVYCDCLLGLLADFLVAAQAGSPDELEGLVALFRDKLDSAMSRRFGVVGHASVALAGR
jgi:hypothetical protein